MEKRRNVNIYYGVALLLILIVIVFWRELVAYDTFLTEYIYNYFDNRLATEFFDFVTDYTIGSYFGLLVVLMGLLYFVKRVELGVYGVFCVLILLANTFLKHVLLRLRPYETIEGMQNLTTSLVMDQYSFPSSHSAFAFFIAYYLSEVLGLETKYKWVLYFMAVMVAISRVYLGVHFVSDVVVGSIVGLIAGMIAKKVVANIKLSNLGMVYRPDSLQLLPPLL